MKLHRSVLGVGGVALALGIWFLAAAGTTAADDKNVRETVQKIADMIEKNDEAGAKKLAEQVGKKMELNDAMSLFALRAKKGVGFGSKAGAVTPDGIEAQLIGYGRKPKTQKEIDAQAADLQ